MQIYRGEDFKISDKIIIHQPTLGEIADWGEQDYFGLVHSLTATPTDLKYQLSVVGIDWNEISDFDCFRKRYHVFTPDFTKIIFGDLDISSLEDGWENEQNGERILYNPETGIGIDRSVFTIITDYLRKAHNIKRNDEKAMTEMTRIVLLEEAKENYEASQRKSYESVLLPLVSTLTNMEGFKYGWKDVWDMKINAFMDAAKTIQHVKNVDLLLNSGYSGFGIDLSKITNKSEKLNYFARPKDM